jgi:lysophospholipase L1-like esterase
LRLARVKQRELKIKTVTYFLSKIITMRFLFIISIIFNFIFAAYVLRKVYIKSVYKPPRRQELKYLLNRDKYLNSFPIISNDIVFAGDSETELFDLQEEFNNKNIKNRGIIGDGSAGLLNRFDPIIVGKPKKIFIEIGINDIRGKMPVKTIADNILMIILKIKTRSPTTNIYIESIFPCNLKENGTSLIPIIKRLNQSLYKICIQQQVTYIDLFSLFLDKDRLGAKYDCGDGLHLSGDGYNVWKIAVSKYL